MRSKNDIFYDLSNIIFDSLMEIRDGCNGEIPMTNSTASNIATRILRELEEFNNNDNLKNGK